MVCPYLTMTRKQFHSTKFSSKINIRNDQQQCQSVPDAQKVDTKKLSEICTEERNRKCSLSALFVRFSEGNVMKYYNSSSFFHYALLISRLKSSVLPYLLGLVLFFGWVGFCTDAWADEYEINAIGDWATDTGDDTTLAGAMHLAIGGDSIVLAGDMIDATDWATWVTSGAYTVFNHTASDLTFDLNDFVIGGVSVDIRSGGNTFTFQNGTFGISTDDMRIGFGGDSNVVLNDSLLEIGDLEVGSATGNGTFSLNNLRSVSSAGAITLKGSGSVLGLDNSTLVSGNFSATGGSTLRLEGGSALNIGGTMNLDAAKLNLINSTLTSGNFTAANGSTVTFDAGSTLNVVDLTVSGASVYEQTPGAGDYQYTRSKFSGSGTLNYTGNLLFEKGANVDLTGLLPSYFTVTPTQGLTVDGIYSHKEGATSFQTTVNLGGVDLNVNGGTVNVTNGADLTGVRGITTTSFSTLNVTGAAFDADSGEKYHSWLHADGPLSLAGGTVNVLAGGEISGLTDIFVGNGDTGTLNISGRDNQVNANSTVTAVNLYVGHTSGDAGILNMSDAGQLNVSGNTYIGHNGTGTATIHGVGSTNKRTTLQSGGEFTLGGFANGSLDITSGALVDVAGTAIIGRNAGILGKLNVEGRGGTGNIDASFHTAGELIVGNAGDADVKIGVGGNVTSGEETVLAAQSTSNVTVTIAGDHYLSRAAWNAGGTTGIAPGAGYVAPSGNAALDVQSGVLAVSGLFAMAGDNTTLDAYGNTYGVAKFSLGSGGEYGELRMDGAGSAFINMDENDYTATSKGLILFNSGSVVSGSGNIYAGEQFAINGGTIAPGSRWMYDFHRNDLDKTATVTDPNDDSLFSIGHLHIYDHDDVITEFYGTTYRTELDRDGTVGNLTGLADRTTVHGDLTFDPNFTVDISRPLNGKYLLIDTVDGGTISNFTPQSLDGSGGSTIGLRLNLNGKLLEGNDRIDYSGGMFTTLEDGNTKVYLTVDTTSDGNVISYWTGTEAGGAWSMTARNFEAVTNIGDGRTTRTFAGDDQFLDGDIVVFDFRFVDSDKRTVTVTTDAVNYSGDLHTVGNVRVAEINVLGNADAGNHFVWDGGGIFAYDSALYSTLDHGDNPAQPSPSGRFNKIGDGVLDIYNANEFYGGIHLGGTDPEDGTLGVTGGRIILYNDKGLGTYNSLSGFQQKGLVTVHEDSIIQLATPDMTINNRFIVMPEKVLTFEFTGDFTIAGNNALAGNAENEGKGGGIFISNTGQIVYMGTGNLKINNNQGSAGGGIYTQLGYTLQVPAYINNNYAANKGGGIFVERFFQLTDGSDISGNAAQGVGGGIYVGNIGTIDNTPGSNDSQFIIHGNTTILNNRSGGATGGGVYVDAGRELIITTQSGMVDGKHFKGGDVWFEGNYAQVEFDPDTPSVTPTDTSTAIRNSLHLSNLASVGTGAPATLTVNGPYNTYFYDALSGDTGTKVDIVGVAAGLGTNTEAAHNVTAGQSGTTVFHADSAFYGDTNITSGATFRLETYDKDENGAPILPFDAIYGRKGSLSPTLPSANTFTVDADSFITGQGTIAADIIDLSGIIDLNTGTFSKPNTRDGSGVVVDAGTKQGVLTLDGDVTVAGTSNWYLNLTGSGTTAVTDRMDVLGNVTFDGTADPGEKLTLDIDGIVRGKYTLLTATGTISDYNTNKRLSDAEVYLEGDTSFNYANTGALNAGSDPRFGRLIVTSYVDAADKTAYPDANDALYLDINGRNRHVTASADGTWGYVDTWTFDASGNPTGTSGTAGLWSEADTGPTTDVYLDGDMVTLAGGTYTLISKVNPVDLFVNTGNVTISGTNGITTFSTAATSTATVYGQDYTTISTSGTNDYGISHYTGKLYKDTDATTLTFTNTGGNLFSGGIVFGYAGADAGTISFNDADQLVVGAGKTIEFLQSGTLQFTGTTAGTGVLHTAAVTTTGTDIVITGGATATFDVTGPEPLTISGVISETSGSGAIEKTEQGELILTAQNTFTGGTTWNEGDINLNGGTSGATINTALGTYTGNDIAGKVTLSTGTAKTLISNDEDRVLRNRFVVDNVANNGLTINHGTTTFTLDGVNAGNTLDGGAIYVDSGADQLAFSGTGALVFSDNKARNGGVIYTAATGALTFLDETTFTGNEARSGSGGGIYANGNVVFNNGLTLGGATADLGNAALAGSGGGIYATGTVTVTGATTLANNQTATYGGAIYANNNVTFAGDADKSITANTAGTDGGAIYTTGNVAFTNTTGAISLSNNTATTGSGGGIYAAGTVDFGATTGAKTITGNSVNTTDGKGGTVYAQNITLTGSATIGGTTAGLANTAYQGGAFYVNGGLLSLLPTGGTINFAGNTAAQGSAVYLNNNAGIQIGDTTAMSGNVIFNDSIYGANSANSFTTASNFTGTVMFAGGSTKPSTFDGTTTINNGTFRITGSATDKTTYGASAGASNTFTLGVAAKLAAGGTLEADTFALRGLVLPDKNTTATSVPTSISDADSIGTLTFQGGNGGDTTVTMYGNSTLGAYQYDANLKAALAEDDPDAWKATGEADLISVTGIFNAEIGTDPDHEHNPEKIIIDVHGFGAGKYKLIEADELYVTRNGVRDTVATNDVDGIDTTGAFDLLVNNAYHTNRHQVLFMRGTGLIENPYNPSSDAVVNANDDYNTYVEKYLSDNHLDRSFDLNTIDLSNTEYWSLFDKANNELWLTTQTYNLVMYWSGADGAAGTNNIWQGSNSTANANWQEKIITDGGRDPETHFMNADSVVFADQYPTYPTVPAGSGTPSGYATPAVRAITINGTVAVTNMLVDSTGTYSFDGGTITTTPNFAGDELEEPATYGGGGPEYTRGAAPQKLQKQDIGTLTFTNTANTFSGGIFFEEKTGPTNAGTIAFDKAAQLGDGGLGITFNESGTLQANAAITLTNKLYIADGKTATFNTNYNVTHSGIIDEINAADTGYFTKSGTGTLILGNTGNDYSGTTTVSAGTLQANGVGTLGSNVSTHQIQLANGATLNLNITTGTETLSQLITNVASNTTGVVTKSGDGTLTLDNTNTYSGQTNVTGGRLIAETVGAINGSNTAVVNMSTGATLEMKLDGTTESGTLAKQLTGAGNLAKSGNNSTLTLTNTGNSFTGTISVSGGTAGNISKITANNATTLNQAATAAINLTGAYDHLEINQTATGGALARQITGSGRLIKTGSENLTISGANTFTGGTELAAGGLTLNNVSALGAYTVGGTSLKGQVDIIGTGTKTVTLNTATGTTFNNRFNVTGGTFNLANATGVSHTIDTGANSNTDGGAVALATGTVMNLTNAGNITFAGNTENTGAANDIYMAGTAALNFNGTGNTFINSGIRGTGTITKSGTGITQIGADSDFNGTTSISGGTFRVTTGKTYGGTTNTSLTLANGATLAGGGTINADTITLNGVVSPDKAVLSAANQTIADADKFGTLTLDGTVTLGSTFKFDYNADVTKRIASNAVTTDYGVGSGNATGDLIRMQNGTTYTIHNGAAVNFLDSLTTGKYLIFTADDDFSLRDSGGIPTTVLDGIRAGGVLKSMGTPVNASPRGMYQFVWGTDGTNDIESQVWLDLTRNSLTMDWNQTAAGTYAWDEATANWQSQQVRGGTHETQYNDGDLVNIGVTAATTLNLTGDRLVAGLNVSGASSLTIGGDYGITAVTSDGAKIEGEYLLPGAGTERLIPTGKLTKTGSGTLTFTNTGANTFTEGIDIAAGTIAFNNAAQLGDGGNGITFTGNGILQANATGLTLANRIIIDPTMTATIATQTHTLTLSDLISGNALTKTGAGTLILTETMNSYSGTTTISAGTLRALSTPSYTALGENAAGTTHQVNILTGAELELQVDIGIATLNQQIIGGGAVEKIGTQEQTLTHANNTYSGGTTVTAGTLTAQHAYVDATHVGSLGTGAATIASGATLKFDIQEDASFAGIISGDGRLVKSNAGTDLTLSGANTYSGGTIIQGGTGVGTESRIIANRVDSIGTGGVNLVGQYNVLRFNNLAAEPGTYGGVIIGAGQLEKTNTGTVTLSGTNTFTGGTVLSEGGLTLENVSALGAYDTAGGMAGQVDITGAGTKTITLNTATNSTFNNRFNVTGGVFYLTNAAGLSHTIETGANSGTNGGAVALASGTIMYMSNAGNITFTGNTENTGAANDIYMAGTAGLNFTGSGNSFFNSGIKGIGEVTKTTGSTGITQIGADSMISGNTVIEDGTFRVIGGVTYGNHNQAFTLNDGATLAGGGTISRPDSTGVDPMLSVNNVNGIVSPDSAVFSAVNTTILDTEKIATLTFSGDTTFGNTFKMLYDVGTVYTGTDLDAQSALSTGDQINLQHGSTDYVIDDGGIINFITPNSLVSGSYHIMHSLDQEIILGTLTAQHNGGNITTDVRTTQEFKLANADTDLWYTIYKSSLNMDWQDSAANNTWTASGISANTNWLSHQGTTGIDKARIFEDGDYVHFNGSGVTIEIDSSGVKVAGMEVDGNANYTFTGDGGILSSTTLPETVGKYVAPETGTPELVPDGKLTKDGTGTLTFANTGGNTFEEGIEISAGTIAFNRADQLGDGGNGITFLGSGELQANADVTLDNLIKLSNGSTIQLHSNGNTFELTGLIDEIDATVGSLVKVGNGTVVLRNTNNAYGGSTAVNAGTLRAVGVGTLGDNLTTTTINVGNGAKLDLQIAGTETLSKRITGNGAVEKSENGILTLDNNNDYLGGTEITGGKIVAENVDAVGSNNTANLGNGVNMTGSGTSLEFKLDGASESGTFNQRIYGTGQLVKSGNGSTLTLTDNASDYTGNTEITGGRIRITDENAVGLNDAAQFVNLNGPDTSFEIDFGTNGTLNQKVTGTGELVKSGNATATLTNANMFSGGTQWNGGDIHLENNASLSATNGSSITGFVYVNTNGSLSTDTPDNTIQNRFEVASGNRLTFGNALTIADNSVNGENGGAIELKSGASFSSTNPLRLTGNNTTLDGGAIFAPSERITIGGVGTNTVDYLSGNTAGRDGGSIYAANVLVNGGQTISGNTAVGNGGAIFLNGGTSGANAVSTLNAQNGDIEFSGNFADGTANAIHLNQNATLQFRGNSNIILRDGITSANTGTWNNLIDISMASADPDRVPTNIVELYGRSAYYGDTNFEKGLLHLNAGTHFGAQSADNRFVERNDAVIYGVGTIESHDIFLGGTINAGQFTIPRTYDVQTLDFVGATNIGTIAGVGQTQFYIDITGPSTADLMRVDGLLNLHDKSNVDFSTFSVGKYLVIETNDGVFGHNEGGLYGTEKKITDFDSTVAGIALNPYRYEIAYTLEDSDKSIYANLQIHNEYIIWTGANDYDPTFSASWPFNDGIVKDTNYDNKWLNEPLYNWHQERNSVDYITRFSQGDKVAFVATDSKELAQPDYRTVRENIEISTHSNDDNPNSGDSVAHVADMLVIGSGVYGDDNTYRFTGQGIRSSIDTIYTNYEGALGELLVTGEATAIFANDANNFQQGIFLQNGAVAFNNPNQLDTIFDNDEHNNGVTASHGITVQGTNSYGRLTANADNMVLGTVINIENATSEMIIDTNGNNFGDANVLGNYTLTLKHAEIDGHTDPTKGTPTPINGIHGDGRLVKAGAGTLILADENTYAGGTIIEGGTIAVEADNRLGNIAGGIKLDGGTLRAMESFDTGRTINLNNGSIEVDENKTLTAAGEIFGSGVLEKTGIGTLILTGNNTYTGGTLIGGGRLVARHINALGTGAVAIGAHTLDLDFDGALKTGNVLSGTGTINILGNVDINHANTDFTGTARVESANRLTLGDRNALQNAAIILGAGSAFRTNQASDIGALTSTGGILELNGDLTVAGNASLTDTDYPVALFYDGITPTTDKLLKASTIDIVGGTLEVDSIGIDATKLVSGQALRFTIMESTDGLTGLFENLNWEKTNSILALTQYGDGFNLFVDLQYVNTTPFNHYSFNHNMGDVAGVLNWATQNNPGFVQDLIGMNDAQIGNWMDQTRGSEVAANALAMSLQEPWRHAWSRLGIGRVVTGIPSTNHGWIAGIAKDTDVSSDENSYGYEAHRRGFVAGYDHILADNMLVGMQLLYGDNVIESGTNQVDSTDMTFALYASAWTNDWLRADGFVGYGIQRSDYRRFDMSGWHNGRYDGNAVYASLQLSRPFKFNFAPGLVVGPVLGLDYQRANVDSFNESGMANNQRISAASHDVLTARLGVRANATVTDRMRWHGRVSYGKYLDGDNRPEVVSQFSSLSGAPEMHLYGVGLGGTRLEADAGFEVFIDSGKRFSAFGDYEYRHSGRENSHAGRYGLMLRW